MNIPADNYSVVNREPSGDCPRLKQVFPCTSALKALSTGLQAGAASLSAWEFADIMNDPERNPEVPLDSLAYISVVVASALLIASLASTIFQVVKNKVNRDSYIAPFSLIFAAVNFGVFVGAGLRTYQAYELCNRMDQKNEELATYNAYARIHNQDLRLECHNYMMEYAYSFTNENCSICWDTENSQYTTSFLVSHPTSILQMTTVDIDQDLCSPENASPDFWDGVANYTNLHHSGNWPCGPDYPDANVHPKAAAAVSFYLRNTLAGPPMSMQAFPIYNSENLCYHLKGFASRNLSLSSLCINPGAFLNNSEAFTGCVTEAFTKYAQAYNSSFNLTSFQAYLTCPPIATVLLKTDTSAFQIIFSGLAAPISLMTYCLIHSKKKTKKDSETAVLIN